jgi:hypothetical protein
MVDKYKDMIPPEIDVILAEIFELGDKGRGHPDGGWSNQPWMHHLGKAVGHIGKFLCWSKDEPHLYCAMWRLCIAAVLYRRSNVSL